MDHKAVISAYRRYAGVYDLLFGLVFEPGRKRVAEQLDCRAGERVLEAGVGTGLSLPYYPSHTELETVSCTAIPVNFAGPL
ncbi:MAG: hypothetical protein R6X15_08950 [Pseudomonadota bacterium]